MLNYLHFGKEEIIKLEFQPGDTGTWYSCAPAQLDLTFLSKLSGFIISKVIFFLLCRGLWRLKKIEF